MEMMCEFTLPVTFIIGVFMAARGISGWLLLYSKHSVNFAEVV
ncbi:putative membrane protein [Brucella thiophenivorans]|uniref:Putative membrane protein n=1 Tax=Brucella thiophenivorans TaxID=571255 RepID=A0A256FBS6_9HYPH|nr:putative membrane protein [Brucella thiophenivorans]